MDNIESTLTLYGLRDPNRPILAIKFLRTFAKARDGEEHALVLRHAKRLVDELKTGVPLHVDMYNLSQRERKLARAGFEANFHLYPPVPAPSNYL